MSLEVMLR